MMQQDRIQETINRVEAFDIDPGTKSLSFVDRLARENNWSREFADRVIQEYKRFCVLAIHAGHPVTPSEEVDQAWHLHLTYTRSYWDRFCGDVLRQPLHHEPTAGGVSEGEKFRDWYQATLESYERIFGSSPPQDIWPASRRRFEFAGNWRWVNTGRTWLIPKSPYLTAAIIFLAVVLLLAATGCQPFLKSMSFDPSLIAGISPFSWNGPTFLVFYGIVVTIVLAIVFSLRFAPQQNWNATKIELSELSVPHIAVLTGGGHRLLQMVLVQLVSQGHLVITKSLWTGAKVATSGDGPKTDQLSRDVFEEIRTSSSIQRVRAIVPHYQKLVDDLVRLKLRYPKQSVSRFGSWLLVGVIGLGVVRVVQGLMSNHPVEFLVLMIGFAAIVGALLNHRYSINTPAGKEVLKKLKLELQNELPNSNLMSGSSSLSTIRFNDFVRPELNSLMMSVAILGSAALVGTPQMDLLRKCCVQFDKGSHSTGCGAGCGSGGCGGGGCGGGCGGGGCGGCGGCGG